MIYIILIWAVLGIHGGYYFIRGVTKEFDFTISEIPALVVAVACPIISHIATYIVFYNEPSEKILFRRR